MSSLAPVKVTKTMRTQPPMFSTKGSINSRLVFTVAGCLDGWLENKRDGSLTRKCEPGVVHATEVLQESECSARILDVGTATIL